MPQIDDPRHNLRLPLELKRKIAHSAVDNGRSMNAEILARLEASFAPDTKREIENLLKTIADLKASDQKEAFDLLAKATEILSQR
ncbi:Arc family DNA-binding protein [Rhizobium favelukesii]|uniref:Arc family DNA-binding protein n=1 Tax=Rhizobium favelukesii TaxID=348824 RepID=UPI000686EC43|nr:Arc family DNA-binding protein [Rhizobium favelukesii]